MSKNRNRNYNYNYILSEDDEEQDLDLSLWAEKFQRREPKKSNKYHLVTYEMDDGEIRKHTIRSYGSYSRYCICIGWV